MHSCYRLYKHFWTNNRRFCPHVRESVGTLTRQSVLRNRVTGEPISRRFTICARACGKSVQKFGRKIRERLLSQEKHRMSGDSVQVLAPLQAAVKEKVRIDT